MDWLATVFENATDEQIKEVFRQQHIHDESTLLSLNKRDIEDLCGLVPIGLRGKLRSYHERKSEVYQSNTEDTKLLKERFKMLQNNRHIGNASSTKRKQTVYVLSCGVKRKKNGVWTRSMAKPILNRKFLGSATTSTVVAELRRDFSINEATECILLDSVNGELSPDLSVCAIIQKHKVYAGKTRVYLGLQNVDDAEASLSGGSSTSKVSRLSAVSLPAAVASQAMTSATSRSSTSQNVDDTEASLSGGSSTSKVSRLSAVSLPAAVASQAMTSATSRSSTSQNVDDAEASLSGGSSTSKVSRLPAVSLPAAAASQAMMTSATSRSSTSQIDNAAEASPSGGSSSVPSSHATSENTRRMVPPQRAKQQIIDESEDVTREMAASYLVDSRTDGLTDEELTLDDDVIPVLEDGRLLYFLRQNGLEYSDKAYGNSRFILIKETVYDQFCAVRGALTGIVSINPAVLRFISERRIRKFDIVAGDLIQFDPIMNDCFIQWCQDISRAFQ